MKAEAIKIQQKTGKNFVLHLLKLVYEGKQEAKIAKFTYKSTILYEELRGKKYEAKPQQECLHHYLTVEATV